jgi:hypothetical protein
MHTYSNTIHAFKYWGWGRGNRQATLSICLTLKLTVDLIARGDQFFMAFHGAIGEGFSSIPVLPYTKPPQVILLYTLGG